MSISSRSKASREFDQRREFRRAAQDRLLDLAGELAVADHQFVGAVFLKADLGGDRVGEQRKAARDQAGPGAVGAHGRDQFAAARRQRDALCQHLVDHADRQILQQRDALAQRRLERDLAAHRAFGDGRDMRLQPGEVGELVDAFLADHGGIHVGQKKLLAPDGLRLHDDVDRQIAARLAQAGFDRVRAFEDSLGDEGDIDRHLVEQPVRRAGRGQHGARAVDHRAIERGIGGIADQRGDERHLTWFRIRGTAASKAVLIAGPTASGKSALALELAQATGGVVINADSMQVYRDLRIITARPTPEEEARVPHRLYGHVDAAVNFSAGRWVADAASGAGGGARARAACRSSSAAPASISRR